MKDTPSPCVRNCCLNEDDICLGCFRSIEEIMQWANSSEQEKQNIIQLTDSRRRAHDLKYSSKW